MKSLLILALSFFLFACGAEYGKGFHTTDTEYMESLESELIKENISFKKDANGYIYYKSNNENKIKKIHKKLSSYSFVKYAKPEVRDYFKKLLTSKNLDFKEQEKNDGIWIKWYPENKEQINEIEMKVVKYMFKLESNAK